jgi:diguanylate cyclase (GGDEF)-like protein
MEQVRPGADYMSMTARRAVPDVTAVAVPALAAAAVAGFVALLLARPGGDTVTRHVDDLVQLAAAATGALGAAARASRSRHRARLSWGLIAAGCAAWALGQLVWSYYEIIGSRDTPFPSLADAGYLAFPVFALIGLLLRPSSAFTGQGRLRVSLDALLVAGSLFVVSWVTALGEVYRAGADSTVATAVSIAYPGSDVVLGSVAIVVVACDRNVRRIGLVTLLAAIACLTFGDSGFAYLTATGRYGTVNLVDAGWVAGFLLVAIAAWLDSGIDASCRSETQPRLALLLPFGPVGAALAVALVEAGGHQLGGVAAAGACAVALALIARQVLVLLDNRRLVARISHQAFHDEMTGLANRALFSDRLAHSLDLHRRDLRPVTVMLIDLDDFKLVNDTMGHPAGDELLVRVAERLKAVVRTGDTVARLGGDEFAVLVEDGGDPVDVAARVLAALEQAVVLGGQTVSASASIGVAALRPEDPPADAVAMLKRADQAMYAAKRAGKSTACLHSPDLDGSDDTSPDLRAELVDAVRAGALDVAFQPITLTDGRIGGYEALVRWTRGGVPVAPATFLPMARRAQCIRALDRLVFGKAVAEAASWGDPQLSLSVNLDAATLADPGFASYALETLGRYAMPAERVTLEVLESELVEHDAQALATLATLRAAGARVAVDDFGAGYASLVRLQALNPDVVKLDRSLLADTGARQRQLLSGVAQLAHQIGATVVAEGVETHAQLEAAIAAGCDAMQGFLLGRPAAAAEWRAAQEAAGTTPRR